MITFKKTFGIVGLWLALLSTTFAQQKTILINNVEIFNGKDASTTKGNVLIEGNKIIKVSATPIPTNRSANVQVIDGKGKFLMPGLIDAHYHAILRSYLEKIEIGG